MRSLPQKIQALRGCAVATVSKRAMTVGSVMRKSGPLLPEEGFFLGDKLIVLPESDAPGGHRTAGAKVFPPNFEKLRHVAVRRVGLLEYRDGFRHLAILEFHQGDAGGCSVGRKIFPLILHRPVSPDGAH